MRCGEPRDFLNRATSLTRSPTHADVMITASVQRSCKLQIEFNQVVLLSGGE
jgi:hypothetical protein